jgi:hypothetical protein
MPRRSKSEQDREGQHAGYCRPSPKHPWRLICHGNSWRDAWLKLVARVNDADADLIVLEVGKSPATLVGSVESITN